MMPSRQRPTWSEQLRTRHGGPVCEITLDMEAECPHRERLTRGDCLLCDSHGGDTGAFLKGQNLKGQILSGLDVARRRFHTDRVILYFQSHSTTCVAFDAFKNRINEALVIAEEAGAIVVGLSVGTRPDLVVEDVLNHLIALGGSGLEVWLELDIQTLDDAGLRYLRRDHDSRCSLDACAKARRKGIALCAHLISGIPGERKDQLARSAERLSQEGVRGYKFHPLHVLTDTELETLFRRGEFNPPSLERYVEAVALALEVLNPEAEIQRLTADVRPPRLIAPQWITAKPRVLQALTDRLSRPVPALVRRAAKGESQALSEVALHSFFDSIAPLYEAEGRESFSHFAAPSRIAQRFDSGSLFLVALRKGQIRAMAELRPPAHLAMLFVDGDERGQGTGRALIKAIKDEILSSSKTAGHLTVNASPNAVSFYRRQGFLGNDEQTIDGIRFFPMTLEFR